MPALARQQRRRAAPTARTTDPTSFSAAVKFAGRSDVAADPGTYSSRAAQAVAHHHVRDRPAAGVRVPDRDRHHVARLLRPRRVHRSSSPSAGTASGTRSVAPARPAPPSPSRPRPARRPTAGWCRGRTTAPPCPTYADRPHPADEPGRLLAADVDHRGAAARGTPPAPSRRRCPASATGTSNAARHDFRRGGSRTAASRCTPRSRSSPAASRRSCTRRPRRSGSARRAGRPGRCPSGSPLSPPSTKHSSFGPFGPRIGSYSGHAQNGNTGGSDRRLQVLLAGQQDGAVDRGRPELRPAVGLRSPSADDRHRAGRSSSAAFIARRLGVVGHLDRGVGPTSAGIAFSGSSR